MTRGGARAAVADGAGGALPLSLIFLMYNEEGAIAGVLDEALAWCRANLADWEIVVVNDGSTDGSPAIARQVAASEPRVRVVDHPTNRGMGAGMRTGIAHASKAWLVFLASDGQSPPAELARLLPWAGPWDIVLSRYENLPSGLQRRVISRTLRLMLRVAAGIRFTLEGPYLFPTALARELAPRVQAETFFFSFELVQRAVERGARWTVRDVRVRPRAAGRSHTANLRTIRRVAEELASHARRRRAEGAG